MNDQTKEQSAVQDGDAKLREESDSAQGSTHDLWLRVHGLTGAAVGAVVGAVDGYLAATRPGMPSLEGQELTAALGLAAFLNAIAFGLLTLVLGGAYVLICKVGGRERVWRVARTKRALASAAGLGVALVGGVIIYGEMRNLEWNAIDYRAPILGLLALAAYVTLVWLQPHRARRLVIASVATISIGLGVLGWSTSGVQGAESLVRIGTESATSKPLLHFARARFDADGDHFPTLLCRQDCDCNDSADAIYPGAPEEPGNDVDEDCSGADMTMEEVARFDALLTGSTTRPTEEAPTPTSQEPEPTDAPPVEDEGPKLTSTPNVLFIVVDTLRADHLGSYGYHRNTSPNLDKLASEGIVFEQARATGSQTRFSVPAMLVGKYFTEILRTAGKWPRISDKETLIAERFKARGYHTAAWHSITYFAELYGMNQGFDAYDTEVLKKRSPIKDSRTSDLVTDRALAYIDSEAFDPQKPWFFWAYYGDPHSSYLFHEEFEKFGPSRKDAYDAEIQFTDLHIGRLIDGLRERGMLENTVIVITADHGEGLVAEEDHGHRFHGPTLFDEVMRVPLIMWSPAWKPRRVKTSVSLVDLPRTFIELAGLTLDDELRGMSLMPYVRGEDPPHPPVFFEKHKETALPQKGMVLWPCKVIWVVTYNRIKIFNLEEDPKELVDLRKSMPDAQKEELVGVLQYWANNVLKSIEPIKMK